MNKDYGILLISHSEDIVKGLSTLIKEVAKDVSITIAGGTEDGGVGTSFDRINEAIEENMASTILAFYDLGSAKMNLEMAMELTDKEVIYFDTAFIEGAYTAAALLQVGVEFEEVKQQLLKLKIQK